MNTNFAIYKPPQLTRLPISGTIYFVGVTRDTDPDGTILSVETETQPSNDYNITNVSIFAADNTFIYNNTITGATYDNASAYIISFCINFTQKTVPPTVTTNTILNPTGLGTAIVTQLTPFVIQSDASKVQIAYAVTTFGDSQLSSNDLIQQIFTPTTGLFGVTTKSGVNFTLNFPN